MSDTVNVGGRPPFEPRPDQRRIVEVLRANGTTVDTIAHVLDISRPTLKKYFKDELTNGFEKVKASIGAALVKQALAGNVNAQRYWLMTRGGDLWKPTERQEIGFTPGADGQGAVIPLLVLQPVLPSQVEQSRERFAPTIEHEPVADDED